MPFHTKELDRLYKNLKEHNPSSKAYSIYQSAIKEIERIAKSTMY